MDREFTPRLIAIVGGSGAGKSWLADRLQSRLGDQAGRVSLDHFYRDRSRLSPARRERINYDHPRAIDWPRVEEFLRRCRAGQPAALPRYDFATHTRVGWQMWLPRPLVLFEGLWLLVRPAVRRCFDLKLYVDCPAAVRLRRRLARDVAERGRTRAAVRRQFQAVVAPMHARHVAPQRARADQVLAHPLSEDDAARLADELQPAARRHGRPGDWVGATFRAATPAQWILCVMHE